MWLLSRIPYLNDRTQLRIFLILNAIMFGGGMAVYYYHYITHLNGIIDQDHAPFGRDFLAYWTASVLMKQGDVADIYNQGVFNAMLIKLFDPSASLFWRYPPPFLFLVWPLAFFGYKTAYLFWTLLNLGLFALIYCPAVSGNWRWLIFFAPLLLLELFIGQNGLITAALLIGGFRFLNTRPILAGVLFGALIIKPQLAILVPVILIALRHYKAFGAAAITATLLCLLSGLVFGWESWAGFFNTLSSINPQNMLPPAKMTTVYSSIQLLGGSAHLALLIQATITIAVAAFLFLRLREVQTAHWPDWLILSLPAIYLATPYGFTYDFCALSAGWLIWISRRESETLKPLDTLIWLALWYVPIFNQSLNEHLLPLVPLLLGIALIHQRK